MSMIWRDIWGGQQCGAAYDGCSDGTMAQELAPLPPRQTEADVLGDLPVWGVYVLRVWRSAFIMSLTGGLLFTVHPGL